MLKKILVVGSILLAAGCTTPPPATPPAVSVPPIEVFFSPNGGCTDAVVKEVTAAKTSILVQAYSFTSAPIAQALVDARSRGVAVEIVLDKSQTTEKSSLLNFVFSRGIPTTIDDKHAIAHNKIMVIDTSEVLTGSFNFTAAAEKSNAENLLVIHDPALASRYAANWKVHHDHSVPYQPPATPVSANMKPTGESRRKAIPR